MLRRLKPDPEDRQPLWLLRGDDQPTFAGLTLVGILGLALLWQMQGGSSADLVKYDDLSQGEVRFETDLNHAEWPELSELPGVGPTLARRIVEHRQQYGPFRSAEDLRRVRGIGPKTLDRIRPHLTPFHQEH
jgi:competence protein ComEA